MPIVGKPTALRSLWKGPQNSPKEKFKCYKFFCQAFFASTKWTRSIFRPGRWMTFKNTHLLLSVLVNNGKSLLNVWRRVFCDTGFISHHIRIEVNKTYTTSTWLSIGLLEAGHARGLLREFSRIYVNLYNTFSHSFLFVYVTDYFQTKRQGINRPG